MLNFNGVDFAQTIVSGHLGKEPELRVTPNGVSVCSFSVASNRSIKKGEEWVKVANWTNVVVWNKTAENVAKFMHKGDRVLVVGLTQTRDYQDKDGNTRYSTELTAEDIFLLTSANDLGKTSLNTEDVEDVEDIPF